MKNILANIAKFSEDENSTIQAIKAYFTDINIEFKPNKIVAFSSKTKWSGINFENEGSYIIGAPEFILKDNFKIYEEKVKNYSENYRILLLAHSNENFNNKDLPNSITALGFVLISDVIRKEAKNTLKYFKDQEVDIKIISGDNPVTVSKIAKSVGLDKFDNYVDMSKITSDKDLEKAALKYTIFGRVSPTQKKDLVIALQKIGKTVAMTGDGVNDAPALKQANIGIGMGSGTEVAKDASAMVSEHLDIEWPCAKIGSKIYHMSAIKAAYTAYTDANNDDVPCQSPSNVAIAISGICLENGTDVVLDEQQANIVNSYGVNTCINFNGWHTWGNRTAAYPSSSDPKDAWLCCRRMFSWVSNNLILTYHQRVDNLASYRLVQAIIDDENVHMNSLAAQGKIAGGYIDFLEADNPAVNIMNGKVVFRIHLAPWTPAEDICFELEFDPDILAQAFSA